MKKRVRRFKSVQTRALPGCLHVVALCIAALAIAACESGDREHSGANPSTVDTDLSVSMDTDIDSQGPPAPMTKAMRSAERYAEMKAQKRRVVREPANLAMPEQLPVPSVLDVLNESAYGKTVSVDDDAVYLLTTDAVYRYTPDSKPSRVSIDLGYGAALTDKEILYWSKGVLYAASKQGGESRMIGTVRQRPMQIVATSPISWLGKDETDRFALYCLQNGKEKNIYTSMGQLSAPVSAGTWVVFIERVSRDSWRLVRVAANGREKPVMTPVRPGRIPSMLSSSTDGIYYFDLTSRSVHRASLDLKTDVVLAENVVCSPLAVSDRVLCARVEGAFELAKETGAGTILTTEPLGLITTIAGNEKVVAFVNDSGNNQLTLRTVALSKK